MAPKRKTSTVTKKKNKMKTIKQSSKKIKKENNNPSKSFEQKKSLIVNGNLTPINKLNVMQNNWKIEARVKEKFPIKNWKNGDKEGKFFNITVIDASGEIKIVCFNEMVEKFYDEFEENDIYHISKGQIRIANKNYSTSKHEYEIFLNEETEIERCEIPMNIIPKIDYDLKTIEQIYNCEKNEIINLIAMCTFVEDLNEFTAKSTGRHLKKRELTLQDETGSLQLTLWNEMAEKEYEINTIFMISNGKINEFQNKKNVTTTGNTIIRKNPNTAESIMLKKYFK